MTAVKRMKTDLRIGASFNDATQPSSITQDPKFGDYTKNENP